MGNLPKGAACILVTHDMTEARGWCDRVLAMLAGRVIEEFDLAKTEPVHPYARMLFDPWSSPVPRHGLTETGCPFRLDCPLVDERSEAQCAAVVPSLVGAGTVGHRVACHVAAPAMNTEA